MFKKIPILVFLVLVISPLDAQKKYDASTYLGLNGGVGLGRVSFTPVINQDAMPVTSFGLVFHHVSEAHIGTQIELNYSSRGWIENLDTLGTYKRNLRMLDLPLMTAFMVGSRNLRLAVTLGPYISFVLSQDEHIQIADTSDYRDYYQKPLAKGWEFGFIGGVAVEYHTKFGAIGLRGSYFNGLTNLFPLNESDFYYNNSRSQVFQIGLTYMIRI
jgi:hypothetical protein